MPIDQEKDGETGMKSKYEGRRGKGKQRGKEKRKKRKLFGVAEDDDLGWVALGLFHQRQTRDKNRIADELKQNLLTGSI